MALLGQFIRSDNGFFGRIQSLTLNAELALIETEFTGSEKGPHYRIHLGADSDGPEIGVAWRRSGASAGKYVSLIIDDPLFGQPLRANLFRAPGDRNLWMLHWSRKRSTSKEE